MSMTLNWKLFQCWYAQQYGRFDLHGFDWVDAHWATFQHCVNISHCLLYFGTLLSVAVAVSGTAEVHCL